MAAVGRAKDSHLPHSEKAVLPSLHFDQLIQCLTDRNYEVIGPTLRDGAIVLDRIESDKDLPIGWTAEQEPGRYRLQQCGDGAIFGFSVGPDSWKKFLHPADVRLWSAQRDNQTFRILDERTHSHRPYAFLGVRACELAALAVLERVLTGDRYCDAIYQSHREGLFLVAVQCTHSAATCFCASLNSGPGLSSGFDLALTELGSDGDHRFLITTGSDRGAEVLAHLPATLASAADLELEKSLLDQAARQQMRAIDPEGLKDFLQQNLEHAYWEKVAARCLSCGNCTMVCPTCFCTTVEDVSALSGDCAERWRRWDSCFTLSFSYIHGGHVRASGKARYRQWLTHKLASWIDQFGCCGCVGCGRCITWCPVGIDITQEVQSLKEVCNHGKP